MIVWLHYHSLRKKYCTNCVFFIFRITVKGGINFDKEKKRFNSQGKHWLTYFLMFDVMEAFEFLFHLRACYKLLRGKIHFFINSTNMFCLDDQ